VVTDVLGKSGRAMLAAIAEGGHTTKDIAAMADCRLRATPDQLAEALEAG